VGSGSWNKRFVRNWTGVWYVARYESRAIGPDRCVEIRVK